MDIRLEYIPPGYNQLYAHDGRRWRVERLIELSSKLIPFEVEVASFKEIDWQVWESSLTIREVIWHCKRIQDADLKFPIILSQEGHIMDGCHRLAKCIMEGIPFIKAVQFEVDPEPEPLNGNPVHSSSLPSVVPGGC